MSQEQPQRPVTYGDVFLNAPRDLAGEVVTPEDAALMQSAEALATGHTHKHGAASAMQSAAARNVHHGFVDKDAHSPLAEIGVTVVETVMPGAVLETEYLGTVPVAQTASPLPTRADIAASEAVTIGEALEAAAVGAGDRPVQLQDARAIQSAEVRATGMSAVLPGGLSASAQSAADHNVHGDGEVTTLADVLVDATMMLPADKVVTQEDAAKVREAELRGGQGEIVPGGVAASMQAAADLNERSGLLTATETQGIRNVRDVKTIPVQFKQASKPDSQDVSDSPAAPSVQPTAGETEPLLSTTQNQSSDFEASVPQGYEKFPQEGMASSVGQSDVERTDPTVQPVAAIRT